MPNADRRQGLIDTATVARFRQDFERLAGPDAGPAAIAVSGGPDSMALLRLAAAALPDAVTALTVNHGLRPEAAGEAALVRRFCDHIGVEHVVLDVVVRGGASIQAAAREARYSALLDWCRAHAKPVLMTAHHADDQAETMVMRLLRGAGLPGLTGIRAAREDGGVHILRPLLRWRREELAAIVADIETVQDPSNADPRHDRTRIRAWLRMDDAPDAQRLSASAAHLAQAEEALVWVTAECIRTRCGVSPDGSILADIEGLPRELRRRILSTLIGMADSTADGPTLDRAMDNIEAGRKTSISGWLITPGGRIRLEKAPERR